MLESSAFSNGYYHLHLAYPVQAGTYLCRVPGQYLTSSCLHGDHDLAGQASVTVDGVQAKVIVMEAELRAVKVKTQQLKQELDLVSSINREASADRALVYRQKESSQYRTFNTTSHTQKRERKYLVYKSRILNHPWLLINIFKRRGGGGGGGGRFWVR